VTDTAAVQRLFDEVAAEYDQHLPAVGFTDVEQHTVQESFALNDPQHYWDFVMSHGFRGHVYSLGPRLAAEFRARLFAGLERMQAGGGITVSNGAVFTRARKPSGG